jgi:radical SAM family uncharacterized protein/radical SAM-linked protein
VRSLLPLLPRPSLYTGLEEGAARKDPRGARIHCALAFPDTYEVGMSYLGQKILYSLLNRREDCLAERVFAPCREAGRILREHGKKLATLETGTPLADLHLLGFSVTHELCYTNVLYMLDLAGIPLRSEDRMKHPRAWPLILAGGGCALNAEPLAPFIDVMCLGDGEELLPQLVELLIRAREEQWPRARFPEEASALPGVYVPSFFAERDGIPTPLRAGRPAPARRVVNDLDAAFCPTAQVVPIGAVHNRLALEISRGCTRGCRFCQAGMLYRPVRERSLPLLEKLVEESLNETGFDELSFLSLSAGDFSALEGLFNAAAMRCAARQVALALPSLRVGSVNDAIMAKIAGIRRTGATLAPEAGSRRLRDVINKGVTEEDLIAHAQKLLGHGWRRVKLYFMIGLPTETREDLDDILLLSLKVRDAAGRGGPRLSVTVSLSPFVPKAHTPFQWEAQTPPEQIRERTDYLISLFRGRKDLRLRWHKAEMSCLEGVLSRGDRRLAPVLERAYAKGAIFSNWTEGFSLEPWIEALRECGWKIEDWIGPRTPGEPLPWDHLESGIDPAFLLGEREKAFAGIPSPDCRYGACAGCGVCRTKKNASRLARPGLDGDIRTRLNFPRRDQERDAPGNDAAAPPSPPATFGGKSRPPHLAAELGVKAVQYRIWHGKENGAAFLSQLELQSVLERAMRRADLPLAFSRGFHPLPLISFGRALPVGVSSLAEWFAVTLRERLSPSETAMRLAPRLPRGMELLRVEAVNGKSRNMQAQREIFRIDLRGDAREKERFLEHWRAFEKTERFLLRHVTGKGEREIDLRALVGEVTYPEDSGVRCLMDWAGGYLSPLVLARAVSREENAARLAVVKLEQIFL